MTSNTNRLDGMDMTDELINLLREIRPSFSDVGSRDVDTRRKQNQINRAIELLSARKPAAPLAGYASWAHTKAQTWWSNATPTQAAMSAWEAAAALHPDTVTRLKLLLRKLGLENAVPDEVARDSEGLFVIFGMMRPKIDALLAASPAAPAQSGEPVTWRDAIKSYPSPDMTLAPQSSQPVEAGEPFDAMKHQTLLGYDASGNAIFGTDPEALAQHKASCSAVVLDDERAIPADCDVRKILLRVVPGDGDGHEVYARNVADVEELLSEMGERLENFELARAASPQATATQPAQTARALTDEQILALNAGEVFFSESPSKYPEAGHGTQYHCGAPGLLKFARAILAAAQPASGGEAC